MVAGGGGGGGFSGGGGAGGVLFNAGETLSGMKVIVIGDGGVGGIGYSNGTAMIGNNGINTTFTGLTSVVGGGGGGGYSYNGNAGGSGGGAGFITKNGGSATSGQGYNGGNSSGESSGGGGGAGGTGFGGSSHSYSGNGGLGVNYTSTFGTTYGDGGWFASGGGGGVRRDSNSSMVIGVASQGGGANGWWTHVTKADDAQKHTGGGGGGGGFMGSTTNIIGGDGGSGIVLIKYTTDVTTGKKIPKITSISNVTTTASKTINYTFNTQGTGIDKITYKIGSGSEVSTASGVYTLAYTPADFGTTVLTYAYPINSSSTKIGPNFGPYSVATKQSSLGHITPAILLFMSMGTTVTDSVNNVAFTTDSGSFTYDTTNNAITNSSSARMKLDFTSVRTDRATAISAFYEFYLPSNTDYGYAASLGGVHDGTGNNNDAIGWYGHDSSTPITHYWANGTQALPTQYNYSNYYGKWIKIGWVREASGNNFKTYIDGVLASTHTPSDGSLTGTGVLSYFYLFRHACGGDENRYTTNDAISFRNLEIYQASFTDAQILAAYGP
jgi:hypothetical protein